MRHMKRAPKDFNDEDDDNIGDVEENTGGNGAKNKAG